MVQRIQAVSRQTLETAADGVTKKKLLIPPAEISGIWRNYNAKVLFLLCIPMFLDKMYLIYA